MDIDDKDVDIQDEKQARCHKFRRDKDFRRDGEKRLKFRKTKGRNREWAQLT